MSKDIELEPEGWETDPDYWTSQSQYEQEQDSMEARADRAKEFGIPDAVLAGFDMLCDDNMDPERAAQLLMAAHRSGRDVEAFARHLLKLRHALRDSS